MFDFIRKPQLWEAMDSDWYDGVMKSSPYSFHLKTIQDVVTYPYIKETKFGNVGEIGGGSSRLLPFLVDSNNCFNIEKFEGADGGPKGEIKLPGVTNIKAFLCEFSDQLKDDSFDVLFSISVVEHVPDDKISDFFTDCVRILKPGGFMVHAIDMYLAEEPTPYWHNRYNSYKSALVDNDKLEPLGSVYNGPLRFACDFASNPDSTMHSWRKIAPALDELRQKAQSVSLLWGARKL